MYFSGKVTHSVLVYMNSKGVDLEKIQELTELPFEFLEDPTCWLDADDVEAFLEKIQSHMQYLNPGESLIEKIGHKTLELQAWGILDNVLKMLIDPQDIFNHPQRILSYFISPTPSFEILEEKSNEVIFSIGLSQKKYPNTIEFLRSSFEALPSFMGRSFASVRWTDSKVHICWTHQDSLLSGLKNARNIKPELMKSLATVIEDAQREVDKKTEDLKLRDQEIQDLRLQVLKMSQLQIENFDHLSSSNANELNSQGNQKLLDLKDSIKPFLHNVQSQFMRLSDYLTRSQQLVTLLSKNKTKEVTALEKKLDWLRVKESFTNVVQDGINNIEGIKQSFEDLNKENLLLGSRSVTTDLNGRIFVNLDRVVENAISQYTSKSSQKDFYIHRMLFFDRKILVNPQDIESLLCSIFAEAESEKAKDIRVLTRSNGSFAEIEIVQKSSKNSDPLGKIKNNLDIQNIIKDHKGQIKVFPLSKKGSTVVIDLPI